ncbi:MAG: biliverdin-producing heme oxygenase [Deltaproteobacteria bacterium]|nr:biliverdin-producing heme oxygenase [Deltaproteobacteria bacterium]
MIERLNDETRPHHAEADSDLDVLFRRETSATDYMLYLMRLYGFEAPLESALMTTPTLDLMLNLRERSRSSLIAKDLMALGLRPVAVAELPMCLTIPSFRGAAEALGWMYVCERATLAHSVIRHHLLTRFPIEMQNAANYLQAYAGTAGGLWRKFGTTLDHVGRHPAIADRVIASAHDAFRAQRRWLQNEQISTSARAAG